MEFENPMDQEQETQEVEERLEDGGAGEVVDPQETDAEDGSAGEGGEQPDSAGQEPDRKEQSHADNAFAKSVRLRAQRETEARMREQFDEEIAQTGVVNPATGKPFSSFKEFKDYAQQLKANRVSERAKKENRPVAEILEEEQAKELLRKQRKEAEKAEAGKQEAAKRRDFMMADLQDFQAKYPKVDVAKLESDPRFKRFAGSRLYREPLAELYEGFKELVGESQAAGAAKAAGKQERSSGSGGTGAGSTLTPSQKAELDEWNRENPHMKMTAKEFLSM